MSAIVSPWFARRRLAALSAAYNGASIGGGVFSPLWVALIGWLGFPLAAASVGLGMVSTVAILAAGVLPRTPESMGQSADGESAALAPALGTDTLRDAISGATAVLTLGAGMVLALFAQIGLIIDWP